MKSREKKELPMDIHARPCNMASEGNNIFPRRLSVKVKEASGIFLITLLTNLHRCTLTRILILHPELREAIIFESKMTPKFFFTDKTIFNGEFLMFFSSPFRGQKLANYTKNEVFH